MQRQRQGAACGRAQRGSVLGSISLVAVIVSGERKRWLDCQDYGLSSWHAAHGGAGQSQQEWTERASAERASAQRAARQPSHRCIGSLGRRVGGWSCVRKGSPAGVARRCAVQRSWDWQSEKEWTERAARSAQRAARSAQRGGPFTDASARWADECVVGCEILVVGVPVITQPSCLSVKALLYYNVS